MLWDPKTTPNQGIDDDADTDAAGVYFIFYFQM